MKITLEAENTNRAKVHIEHNDEKLTWDVSAFDKSNFSSTFDLFHYNNLYWQRKSKAEQDEIFSIFKRILIAFNEINDWKQLSQTIQILLKSLFEHHDLNEIKSWILFHTDIQFPYDLATEYIPSNDKTGSREQTYILADYHKLISLIFCLRLMVPIWGEFIVRAKHETGTSFKEYYAYLLLSRTNLFHSEPMEKLITYVNCTIPDDNGAASILAGMSTEDFPTWVLSLVIIRRLCTNDIRGHLPDSSIIPYIYNHVRERVKRSDAQFDGAVKDKEITDSSDSEGRVSALESYKIRQDICNGDVVYIEHALSNIVAVVKKLEPTINDDLLLNALETSQALLSTNIHPPQICLAQWIFKPYVSPKGLKLISKKSVVSVLGATQAILWHRKHYVLASIATAAHSDVVDDTVSAIESRARLTKELVAEISKYFPYVERTSPRKTTQKTVNLVIESIDELCSQLSSYNWYLTLDKAFLPILTGNEFTRAMVIPHDIRLRVANLVLDLVKKRST